MVKVIELPENLREICPREIWVPESERQSPPAVMTDKEPQQESKPKPQRKLDLGTPF